MSHGLIAVDYAATRGDDMVVDAEVKQNSFLNVPESRISVMINNILQFSLLRSLNKKIRIYKVP